MDMPSVELGRMWVKQVWEEQKYGVHSQYDKLSNVLMEEVTRQLAHKYRSRGEIWTIDIMQKLQSHPWYLQP